jgi:hypothetical protein
MDKALIALVSGGVAVIVIFVGLTWHIRKYGDVGFFHHDPPPSILDEPPPVYEKDNLKNWAEVENERNRKS